MTSFAKPLAVMTRPMSMVFCLILIIFSYLYIDKPLAEYLFSLNLRVNLSLLNWLTKLGLGILYLGPFLAAALFFKFIKRHYLWEIRFWFLWLCALIPSCICLPLKIIFGRARPDLWLHNHYYGFYGLQTKAHFWSFPSGHTSTIMGVVFGLSIVFPRYCYAFLPVGLMIALSRVLLTHHYLSDVLSAAFLALLEIALLMQILRKKSWLKAAWQYEL